MTPRTNLAAWLRPDPEQGNTTSALRWRKAAGHVRAEVARELHVHEKTLGRWEKGLSKPRGENDARAYEAYLKSIQPEEES